MPHLTPAQAARVAQGVYDLRDDASVEDALKLGVGLDDFFPVTAASRFSARSGALMFRPLSGFGYVAAGTGPFEGEVLIATRGTATIADWITDAQAGVQLGPSSMLVHAGFNEVWKGYRQRLFDFFEAHPRPTRIHCVGHSLGGALATLNADWLTNRRIGGEVVLYSFGCPRVGDGFFARSLTQRLGAGNIYRVCHPADPVPMIPLFPFWHLPTGSGVIELAARSALINPNQHKMKIGYTPAMAGVDWDALRRAAARQPDEDAEVRQWLGYVESNSPMAGLWLGSALGMKMIGKALAWLVKSALKVGVGLAVVTVGTALDKLAWLLTLGAKAIAEIGKGIWSVVQAIGRVLGRVLPAAGELTYSFLRWVLGLLYQGMATMGRAAVGWPMV